MRAPISWTDVDASDGRHAPAAAGVAGPQSIWTRGWRRYAGLSVLLAYLWYVGGAVTKYSRGAGAVFGIAALAAFAVCWLVTVVQATDVLRAGQTIPRRYWIPYGVLVALFAAELPFARAAAFVLCIYLTIATVIFLGARAAPVVVALALAALLVPVAIPSWHTSLSGSFDDVTPLALPVVALSMYGFIQVHRGNLELAEARSQLASLAAENERSRIARDLHDLLGHSLTTITVKAGLATRLGQADPARALEEIAEVEALARRSLADVRAAVANYRDVTLVGELATGRELLRAASITADLPHAVDVVDPAHQELFGWAVREGLTNIVRHSHASSCAVRLSASAVEIVDDGVGGTVRGSAGPPGNGLKGLRERVAAAGGVVDAGPLEPRGWRLRVSLSPTGSM
jgi:two-component system, NarL family, sensor histidine kinase DesK